jgi:hypothetical protein
MPARFIAAGCWSPQCRFSLYSLLVGALMFPATMLTIPLAGECFVFGAD